MVGHDRQRLCTPSTARARGPLCLSCDSSPLSCTPCRPTYRVARSQSGGPLARHRFSLSLSLFPTAPRSPTLVLRAMDGRSGPCVGGVTGHGSRISGLASSSSSYAISSYRRRRRRRRRRPSSVQLSSFEGGKNKVVGGARSSERDSARGCSQLRPTKPVQQTRLSSVRERGK